MIVREYWPGFVDRADQPREAKIDAVLEALSIPWLQEKGELTIDGNCVKANGCVVAIIWPDRSAPSSVEEFRREYLSDWSAT